MPQQYKTYRQYGDTDSRSLSRLHYGDIISIKIMLICDIGLAVVSPLATFSFPHILTSDTTHPTCLLTYVPGVWPPSGSSSALVAPAWSHMTNAFPHFARHCPHNTCRTKYIYLYILSTCIFYIFIFQPKLVCHFYSKFINLTYHNLLSQVLPQATTFQPVIPI